MAVRYSSPQKSQSIISSCSPRSKHSKYSLGMLILYDASSNQCSDVRRILNSHSYLKRPTKSRTKPQTLQSHSVSLCAFFLATYLTKPMPKIQHITFTLCPMRTIPDTTECNTLYETYQRRQLLFTLQMLVSWNLTPETCFLLKSHFGSLLCCAFQTLTPTYE